MFNPFMAVSYVAIEKWLAAHPPELAFDIGANEGGYTDLLLRSGAKKVIAFEPLPMLAEKLRFRFAEDCRVEVRQIGLREHAGVARGLSVLGCWTLADKDATNLDCAIEFFGQKFDVDFRSIDSGSFGKPDFIKLDADGYEPSILRGAEKALKAKRPAILLELSYLPQELGDSCDRMVYDLYVRHKYVFVSSSGNFFCRHHREMLGYFAWNTSYDVLAVPAECLSAVFDLP